MIVIVDADAVNNVATCGLDAPAWFGPPRAFDVDWRVAGGFNWGIRALSNGTPSDSYISAIFWGAT